MKEQHKLEKALLVRKLNNRADLIDKMNHAMTLKTSFDLYPVYKMSQEELSFIYQIGEYARQTQTNPLIHLTVDERSRKKHLEDTANFLLDRLRNQLCDELTRIKNPEIELEKIIACSFNFDHAKVATLKTSVGAFTLSIRILTKDESGNDFKIEHFSIPIKTFETSDTTIQRNAEEITKMVRYIFNGNHLTSCSISADGAICRNGLYKHLNDINNETPFPGFGTLVLPCCSHLVFLMCNHTHYAVFDDIDYTSVFFPNHNPAEPRKLFFFDDEGKQESNMKTYLEYWMEILENLDTPARSTNIRLSDYIVELQRKILNVSISRRRNEYAAHANKKMFEEQLIQETQNKFSSSDKIVWYEEKYFGRKDPDEILRQKAVKIPNDPGKKSRRMMNMAEKLCKCALFADRCVRDYFSNRIIAPADLIPNKFILNMAQFVVIQKYLVSIGDSGEKANNITILRILGVVTRAAFNLDEESSSNSEELENPFIG